MKRDIQMISKAVTSSSSTSTQSNKPIPCTSRTRGTLSTLLTLPTKFPNESGTLPIGEYDPTLSQNLLATKRVLVVGAGGLGCELLKNLSMSCIRNIEVIDLDTIDVTNLNRQFLFRQKDVGSAKSTTAASFITTRCPWLNVVPHVGKIQDESIEWYKSFDVIISGLDNVEARRWLNSTIVSLVELDADGDPVPESIIPIIDGGTEGFKGQSRVIIPRITSCFECSLDSFPPQKTFPMCTIAETPRLPEHCISYAFILLWPQTFPNVTLDKDSPTDMRWVYDHALIRANKYNIKGVTYTLTMGVVKNIIPAVASTNAIIAAQCVNEAVKILTFGSLTCNNYCMYMGTDGVYSHTFVYERKEDCAVCSNVIKTITIDKESTLQTLIDDVLIGGDLRLKKPSVSGSEGVLYMQNPAALEAMTRLNLEKSMRELVEDGEELAVTDEGLGRNISLIVKFE